MTIDQLNQVLTRTDEASL